MVEFDLNFLNINKKQSQKKITYNSLRIANIQKRQTLFIYYIMIKENEKSMCKNNLLTYKTIK